MKIIIAGLGRTGRTLIEVLSREGHDITVIDRDSKAVGRVATQYKVKKVVGNAALSSVLKSANAADAQLYIAASGSDELNLLSCLSAKKCGAGHTLALSHAPELIDEMPYLSGMCGVDMIFNPEYETAYEILRSIRTPAAVHVMGFAGGRAELAKVSVRENSELSGRSLAALRSATKLNVLVCAVKRDGKVIIPDGRFVIAENDRIYITGPHDDICSFLKMVGLPTAKVKDAVIIGGGEIALYLAVMLERSGISVKIIEKSEERCRELSSLLSKTQVLNGDPFDGRLLASVGIGSCGVCLTLSDNDEDNVIVSMYAKNNGAKKIITKVARGQLNELLPDMGFNSAAVSEEQTLASIALSSVRALSESKSSAVGTVYRIADGIAEITEFIAKPGFSRLGVPLMRLDIKSGILIAGIVRGNDVLYPNGLSSIAEGDRVITVTSGRSLKDLNDILA